MWSQRRGELAPAAYCAPLVGLGGDLAGGRRWCCCRYRAWTWPASPRSPSTSPDRAREGHKQLQRGRFEPALPEVLGRPPTHLHPPPAPRNKKGRTVGGPFDHGLPFSTWSLAKLAEFLVAEGVVDDISHEGLKEVLEKEQVSFPSYKDLEESPMTPTMQLKRNRVLELYDIAEERRTAG